MRGPWARRLRDLFHLHLSDLGGEDAVSEAEKSICRRAACLTVELERIEAKFAVGEAGDHDLDLYQRTAGNLRRLLEAVGLQRRAKDISGLSLFEARRLDLAEQRAEAEAADALGDDLEGADTAATDERTTGRRRVKKQRSVDNRDNTDPEGQPR